MATDKVENASFRCMAATRTHLVKFGGFSKSLVAVFIANILIALIGVQRERAIQTTLNLRISMVKLTV